MDCRGVSTKSGDFLYSENGVVLKTIQVGEESAREVNGKKLVLAGTVVPSNDENAEGIVFDNVSVCKGEAPASCVVAGRIDGSKVYITDEAKRKLERGGVKFYEDPYQLLRSPKEGGWWDCAICCSPWMSEEEQQKETQLSYCSVERWTAWEPIGVLQIHFTCEFDVERWIKDDSFEIFDKSEYRLRYMVIDHWYDDTTDVKLHGKVYYKATSGDAYEWIKFQETEWIDASDGIQYRAIDDKIEVRNSGETIRDKKFTIVCDLVTNYDYEISDWRKQGFKRCDENVLLKKDDTKLERAVQDSEGNWLSELFEPDPNFNDVSGQSDEPDLADGQEEPADEPAEEQSDEVEPAEEERQADEP